MKAFASTFAIVTLLCGAGAAHAQDIKSMLQDVQGDGQDANRQMDYAENNAKSGDTYSACLNVRNAIADYEDGISKLNDIAAIASQMPNVSDESRKKFMDSNNETLAEFTDDLNDAKRNSYAVCPAS